MWCGRVPSSLHVREIICPVSWWCGRNLRCFSTNSGINLLRCFFCMSLDGRVFVKEKVRWQRESDTLKYLVELGSDTFLCRGKLGSDTFLCRGKLGSGTFLCRGQNRGLEFYKTDAKSPQTRKSAIHNFRIRHFLVSGKTWIRHFLVSGSEPRSWVLQDRWQITADKKVCDPQHPHADKKVCDPQLPRTDRKPAIQLSLPLNLWI